MAIPLKVLIIEDSETDALLVEYELKRGGYAPVCTRVETAADMRRQLELGGWDAIISDYNLPSFNGLDALALAQELGIDLPFIVVSGTIGEETAVATMKAGAHDYLMKDNLARLVPAVERELRETLERKERKKAQLQLRENEARFRLLFEDSPISLWEEDFSAVRAFLDDLRKAGNPDLPGYFREHPEAVEVCIKKVNILSVNKASLRMFGAKTLPELIEHFQKNLFPQESRATFAAQVCALAGGETSFSSEGEVRTLTGENLYIAKKIQVAPGFEESLAKVLVSIIDITQRREAQKAQQLALARTEEALETIRAILRSLISGLLVIDTEGRVVLMNRMAESLLGVELKPSLGQPIAEILSEPRLASHIGNILAGGIPELITDLEITDKSKGELRTVQIRSSMVLGHEELKTGFAITFIDVTREREIDRMKSDFIMAAAHELNTPLASVMGYAELLLSNERFSTGEAGEYLRCIIDKAEALERIINELLNLSHIEYGGAIQIRTSLSSLTQSLTHITDHYRREFANHQFETELPAEGISLLMDPDRMAQVFNHILGNAVKFSPRGGLIRISAQRRAKDCLVSVQDQGIGMTPGQLERVFEKFYRADTSETAVGGLGLGLTIAKSIVEAHGGDIRIESLSGQGTRVRFTLPLPE